VSSQPVQTRTIGGPAQLLLRQTGDLVELIAGSIVLLSSAALGTELGFGQLAAKLGASRQAKRVVIGGLGFGATLRGVLDVVDPDARVTVVEKVDAVIELVRGDLAYISKDPLADPRVELVRGDVRDVLERRAGEVDTVLLDVDNGPHWASFRSNARLYTPHGLVGLKRSLAKGGALAVWSGYRADAFLATVRQAGLKASVIPLQENGRIRARAYVGTLV
jgi:predicted membrane-bound spermidine synthase